jgi:poly(A) polymerase
MRTSEEIYQRVRWDPRFDPSRFVLGIRERGLAEPKRIPLPAFVPGGVIPWHRIQFVEADGELVWDRATRIDRVGMSEAGRARDPRRLRPPFFTARTPHAWDPLSGWCPTGEAAARQPRVRPGNPRVLTWNTLWDRYDSDRIDTARRRPLLLTALAAADPDVIALQEVEPELLGMLLRAGWVRAGYTVGTDPGGDDVDDYGLVLLSRLPVREAGLHVLGPYKALAAITVETVADHPPDQRPLRQRRGEAASRTDPDRRRAGRGGWRPDPARRLQRRPRRKRRPGRRPRTVGRLDAGARV